MRPYLPGKLGITFAVDPRTDINHFSAGEAVVHCRWFPSARVRLLKPGTTLRKFDLITAEGEVHG